MKILEETETYKIIEFDDEDLTNDKDIKLMNSCTIRDIPFEFIDEEETQIKIFKL